MLVGLMQASTVESQALWTEFLFNAQSKTSLGPELIREKDLTFFLLLFSERKRVRKRGQNIYVARKKENEPHSFSFFFLHIYPI